MKTILRLKMKEAILRLKDDTCFAGASLPAPLTVGLFSKRQAAKSTGAMAGTCSGQYVQEVSLHNHHFHVILGRIMHTELAGVELTEELTEELAKIARSKVREQVRFSTVFLLFFACFSTVFRLICVYLLSEQDEKPVVCVWNSSFSCVETMMNFASRMMNVLKMMNFALKPQVDWISAPRRDIARRYNLLHRAAYTMYVNSTHSNGRFFNRKCTKIDAFSTETALKMREILL